MSYKEKIAWLSLFAIIVTIGPYFALVALDTNPAAPMPDLARLWRLGVALSLQAVITIAGCIVLAIRNPGDAKAPADERDHAIGHRAMSTAYYVLIAGMILVGFVMPFTSAGWSLVNAALFMMVVAEIVHNGMVVVGYRRYA